jgi:hypothetical protein
VTTLDMASVLDIESRIGPLVGMVLKNNRGSMYLTEIVERVLQDMPPDLQEPVYAHPWITEQIQDAIHRKVYKWVKSCKDAGQFRDGGQPVVHPTFGNIPDGAGKFLWFRVRDVGERELQTYEDHLNRKVRKAQLLAENIKNIRQRLGGRLVREIIRYDS